MKTKYFLFLSGLIFIAFTSGALAGDWSYYDATDYGFKMLVPDAATIEEKEIDDWGGLYAYYDGIKLWGLAKLGEEASAEEIEKFGVRLAGIPGRYWKEVDSGEGSGWKWFKTVRAEYDGKVVYGGYGTGRRGSYLLLIKTTEEDFEEYETDYMYWYESVQLY